MLIDKFDLDVRLKVDRKEQKYSKKDQSRMIAVFTFEDQNVKIVGDYENPWFCVRDVYKILGYTDCSSRNAAEPHVDKEDKKSLYVVKDTYEQAIYDLSHNEKQTCYINKQCLANLVLICKTAIQPWFHSNAY